LFPFRREKKRTHDPMIISRKEARNLLRQALSCELGLLVWSTHPRKFCQALYRARQDDPMLGNLDFSPTADGIAIFHLPHGRLNESVRADARRTEYQRPEDESDV
jgi:hypothetical protein